MNYEWGAGEQGMGKKVSVPDYAEYRYIKKQNI
jgi:hypothetical protein